MNNRILKMFILAAIVSVLTGCGTAVVYTAGMTYKTQELNEAYLAEKDKLVLKTDEDIFTFHLELDDESKNIDNFSFVKNENTNLHKILTKDKSEVQTFSLRGEYHSIRTNPETSPGTKLEIISDDRLTSLDKPIIYLSPEREDRDRYYLIRNNAGMIQMAKLPSLPLREESSQPAWWPLKLPLYPLAAAIDVAALPLGIPLVIWSLHNLEGLAR